MTFPWFSLFFLLALGFLHFGWNNAKVEEQMQQILHRKEKKKKKKKGNGSKRSSKDLKLWHLKSSQQFSRLVVQSYFGPQSVCVVCRSLLYLFYSSDWSFICLCWEKLLFYSCFFFCGCKIVKRFFRCNPLPFHYSPFYDAYSSAKRERKKQKKVQSNSWVFQCKVV